MRKFLKTENIQNQTIKTLPEGQKKRKKKGQRLFKKNLQNLLEGMNCPS
jgi:hypothetical protein